MVLATTLKLIILAASGIALGIQRKLWARRHRESTLALVSSPELRKAGCEWLCVPSEVAATSTPSGADRVFKSKRSDLPHLRPQIKEMKMVGEFRSSSKKPRRSSSVRPASKASDATAVLMMSERALRIPVKMPLRKM